MTDSANRTFQSVAPETLLKAIESAAAQAGVAPQDFMPSVRAQLRKTPDPRRALNNLQRFLASAFSVTLIREFSAQKVLLEIALTLFSQSQYLADILVRNPELFPWLVSSGALKTTKTHEAFLAEARKAVEPFERTEKKLDALKRLHRREMLRIGARDILREAHIMTITIELSSLADSIIETVLFIGREELKRNTGLAPENPIAVIGLGKLGGNELNFSSDIDIMFVYARDEEFPDATTRTRSMVEYCSRLSEFVVRRLSEHTDEGHLYRVDIRLRPDGAAGPIAMSSQAYRAYYEARGELWERQMLLKARTVAGNKIVGETWLKNLGPFLFPKTHLVSPLKEISEMKKKIEARISDNANIKLGSGGIRDIEFIVQALQLLNGGRARNIRVRPTMQALARLGEEDLMSSEERKDLTEAYEFFRIVEHRLQLLHGTQTHSLPDSEEETQKLSKSLGFRTPYDFGRSLNSKRKRVREIFNLVFQGGSVSKRGGEQKSASGNSALGKLKFIDPRGSRRLLDSLLREVPELQAREIQDDIIRACLKSGSEDWAIRNFALFGSQPGIKRSFLQAMENRNLLDLMVMIASRSARMVHTLSNDPLLFESLLIRPEKVMSEFPGWKSMLESDPLKYKTFNEFRICLRFLLGHASIENTTKALSSLADTVVLHAFEKKVRAEGTCLLALGRLGGQEISIGSDLDLVCVYDEKKCPPNIDQRLKEFVSYFTQPKGLMYEVDFRLRPEGHSAPLATELTYYDTYLKTRASLWEKQSLLKARIVGGDDRVVKNLRVVLDTHLWQQPTKGWIQEILRMRRRMEAERAREKAGHNLKLGKGGMADLEFLVQAVELAHGGKKSSVRTPNTFAAFRLFRRMRVLKSADAQKAQFNYVYLRSLEMMLRLNSLTNSVAMPRERVLSKAVSVGLGERSIRQMKARVSEVRAENRNLFLKTLRALPQ